MATKIYLGAFLILVVLSVSIYFLMPEKVKISIEKTRAKYFVWEDESWVQSATEYVNLYDGTTKMRAKSRELDYWNDSNNAYAKRTSLWKDEIKTIQTYTFKIDNQEVEQFPISNKFECFNCEGKIVHYEIRDILYDGPTQIITSPFSFGHNMKIEWQEGSYYSKVFQQIVSDKIIIKYRPQDNDEIYSVRLFDPWDNPSQNVTLNSPANNSVDLDGSIIFNCSAYNNETFIQNISLLTNISGSLEINQSFNLIKNYGDDYYLIIEADSVDSGTIAVDDTLITDLGNGLWKVNSSDANYNLSRAKVIKTLFFGVDSCIPEGCPRILNFTNINNIYSSSLTDANMSFYHLRTNYPDHFNTHNYVDVYFSSGTDNLISTWATFYLKTAQDRWSLYIPNGTLKGRSGTWYSPFGTDKSADEINDIGNDYIQFENYDGSGDKTVKNMTALMGIQTGTMSFVKTLAGAEDYWNVKNFTDDYGIPRMIHEGSQQFYTKVWDAITINSSLLWTCQACDVDGDCSNYSETEQRVINVDHPRITNIIPNTTIHLKLLNIFANITASGTLDYCYFNITKSGAIEVLNTKMNCSNFTNVTTQVSSEGDYVLNIYANTSTGLFSTENSSFTYDSLIGNLFLDNGQENITIWRNSSIDINGTFVNDSVELKLYVNNILINNGNSPIYNLTLFDSSGIFPVNLTFEGDSTYDAFNIVYYVTSDFIELRLEGFNNSINVELGSGINVIANSTLGNVWIDFNHPEFGANYSNGNVSIILTVNNFTKNTFANGSTSNFINYTNLSSFDIKKLNFTTHKYDEAELLKLNMSCDGECKDVSFYKINTTSFDRAYQGVLKGNQIYLNKTFESEDYSNLTFSNPGSKTIYFYLDDNIGDFNFTLDLVGALYGFNFNDTFGKYNNISSSETDAMLFGGFITAKNTSKKIETYDNFDGASPDQRWLPEADEDYDCVNENCYDHTQTTSQTGGYLRLYTTLSEDFEGTNNGVATLTNDIFANITQFDLHATDDIWMNISYVANGHDNDIRCYDNNGRVFLGATQVWQSAWKECSGEGRFCTEDAGIIDNQNIILNMTKQQNGSWRVQISGKGIAYGSEYNDWGNYKWMYNWTEGVLSKTYSDHANSEEAIDNDFYVEPDYLNYGIYFETYNKAYWNNEYAEGCDLMDIDFKVHDIKRSVSKRDNTTIVSNSIFDSDGDIASATFNAANQYWGGGINGEFAFYLSADNGENWESVTENVEHSFSDVGKHIKWKAIVNLNQSEGVYHNNTWWISGVTVNTSMSNPKNITLDFGGEGLVNYTLGGEINSTNGTILVDLSDHNISTAFTSKRSLYDHTYEIPLVISSDSQGLISLTNFNLTYDPNPIILNHTSFQSKLGNSSEGFLNVSIPVGTYAGNITFNDFSYVYKGGNQTYEIIAHDESYSLNVSYNLTYFYSSFLKNLPYDWTDKIFVMPRSNNEKNISFYGQTSSIPLFNLTTTNYGGRNLNLTIRVNETHPCMNITWNITGNDKPEGNKLNTSWKILSPNLEYLNHTQIWFWVDLYSCNASINRFLQPQIQIESACVDCFWEAT